jgi:hypothetical protein
MDMIDESGRTIYQTPSPMPSYHDREHVRLYSWCYWTVKVVATG